MGKSQNGTIYGLGPFLVMTFIYFIVGFLTTVNGQFQGPLQIAFLSGAESWRNTLTTLISFFFFLGYLVNSGTGGRWVNRHGYKATLARALFIMLAGLLTYSLSAWLGSRWPGFCLSLGADRVPWAFFIFLAGSFLAGSSAAVLQVVINPYVASWELPGTSAVQRMNITTGVNSVGTTVAPFFVSAVIFAGASISQIHPEQLISPLIWLALTVLASAFICMRMNLPDIEGTRSAEDLPRSVWSFSHLALGVLTIFLYVGAEVCIGVNISMHALQLQERGVELSFFGREDLTLWGLRMGLPALLATLYWGGMMIGRLAFSAFPGLSARGLLAACAVLAGVLVLLAMCLDNLWLLTAVGLCHSVMWGCVFTLAVAGLGAYTSRASGAFMMGVFGGAVLPLLQGMLADGLGSWRWTWSLVLACEASMLIYACYGAKVRDSEALAALAPGNPGQ